MRNRIRVAARGILTLCVLCVPHATSAYGVLSHEAIVDTAWESSIAPLLRTKFHPSDAALTEARAFAYGGCLIQDLGYYPFSSRTFGDLTHCVRSGDFVASLLNEASDANEYAFALGALAHYAADNTGHPIGINRAVPMIYPKLRKKYGSVVTYEDNRAAHLKTEFGLDVVQIAGGAYLPTSYHSFRRQMPAVSREQFLFTVPRSKFEQEWGTTYERPGIRSKILAVVLRIIPKVGPFSSLAFKLPTPDAERVYLDSFDKTAARYRGYVAALSKGAALPLPNLNFDTGEAFRPGEYRLADEAQKRLMERVRQHAQR